MQHRSGVVSFPIHLRLLSASGPGAPVAAELRYSAADPFAVEALFDAGEAEPVRWVFARDLLADGLDGPAGHGDVGVSPASDPSGGPVVRIRLSSPDGLAMLEAPRVEVQRFLTRTYGVVRPGAESELLRMDETVAALLTR